MSGALALLNDATEPGSIVETPFVWDVSADWKTNYMRVGDDNRAALLAAGDSRRAEQERERVDLSMGVVKIQAIKHQVE